MRNERERSKKLLIIAQAFPPDNISGAARPGRFAKYLPAFGFTPIVVAAGTAKQSGGDVRVERVPYNKAGRKQRLAAWLLEGIQRYLLPYNDHLPWAAHASEAAQSILKHVEIDCALSTSPPLATHITALWLKSRYRNLKWIADFRDPLHGNPFRTRKWLFPYDLWIEKRIFKHADLLIANTDSVADLWLARHPEHARKVVVLWNGFDPEDPIAAAPIPLRPYRVIAHIGTLYGRRSPAPLLESLHRLLRASAIEPGSVRVKLIGPMDQGISERIKPVATELEAAGCLETINCMVPQEQARRVAAEADFLLLIDVNEGGGSLQVPGKLFDYVRIGRPLLVFTEKHSPVERILSRSGIPFLSLHPGSSDGKVDTAIRDLLQWPSDPCAASQWFQERFDGRMQTRYLASLMDWILAGGTSKSELPASPEEEMERQSTGHVP